MPKQLVHSFEVYMLTCTMCNRSTLENDVPLGYALVNITIIRLTNLDVNLKRVQKKCINCIMLLNL